MAAEPWRVPERLWRELEPLLPKTERPSLSGAQAARRSRLPGGDPLRLALRHPLAGPARLEGLPSGQTCWRRLDEWERAGVWPLLLVRLQERLAEAERIDWSRVIVDASLVDAKRGARRSRAASAAAPAAAST